MAVVSAYSTKRNAACTKGFNGIKEVASILESFVYNVAQQRDQAHESEDEGDLELKELLNNPGTAAFSRLKYIPRFATEEKMAEFINGLFIAAANARPPAGLNARRIAGLQRERLPRPVPSGPRNRCDSQLRKAV